MDLGTRLKQLRLQRSLTQGELADPDYSYAYVSSIEAGRRTPSPKALEFFAAKLGVEPEELATGLNPARELELMAEYLQARRLLASDEEGVRSEAKKVLNRVLKKARSIGSEEMSARCQLGLAIAAEADNDLDGALDLYARVEAAVGEISLATRSDGIAGRARVLQSQGNTPYAAFLLREALANLENSGMTDPAAIVRLSTSLIAAYYDEGLVDMAVEVAETALKLAPRVEEPERLADLNLNYGIVLTRTGRREEAAVKLAEAERWFSELGRHIDMADVQLVRGIGLRKDGRHEEAAEVLQEAQEAFAGAGATLREARASLALGINARMNGGLEQSRFHLKRAVDRAGDDTGIIGIAHREMGLCEDDEVKALKQIRKAINLLKEAGNVPELAMSYSALGDVLSRTDALKPACDAYRAAAEVLMEVA